MRISASVLAVVAVLCGALGADGALPPIVRAQSGIAKSRQRIMTPEQRRMLIDPVPAGGLRLRPLFATCCIVFGAPADAAPVFRYRVGGGEWRKAELIVHFPEVDNWRGVLPDLAEDTEYEVDFSAGGVSAAGRFRTWKNEVPVARTVEIDPASITFPIVVSDKGGPDGWIQYTVKGGETLVNESVAETFTVTNAAYVLLDDMKIVGGRASKAIRLVDSEHVRIRNCDISGWGFEATPHYDDLGRLSAAYDRKRKRYVMHSNVRAISVERGMRCTAIERCWIHDPVSRSVSWRYSHPFGPVAVAMDHPDHSTSIRYCDFTGSDFHRWDDAVIGPGNFQEKGGFNRDAEVYGNFMIFPNDDGIELDGGQQNIDCSHNRFEGGLVGVSIQGNVVSPSFVRHNLFSGMGEEFGCAGQTVKTSGFDIYGQGPYSAVIGNVLWGEGSGLNIGGARNSKDPHNAGGNAGRIGRIDVLDNVFCSPQQLMGTNRMEHCVVRGNRMDVVMDESGLDRSLPLRPLPFRLSACRIDAGRNPAPVNVRVECAPGTKVPFTVAKNRDMDWMDVSPASGELSDGTVFTVSFDKARMANRKFWRGYFLVRTPEGYSRPVSVYAESDYVLPYRAEGNGKAFYSADLVEGRLVSPQRVGLEVSIDLPEEGRFYFMLHGVADLRMTNAQVSIDGADPERTVLQFEPTRGVWCCLDPGTGPWLGRIRPYDLKPGRHTVKVWPGKSRFSVDGAALVEDPGAFEPR